MLVSALQWSASAIWTHSSPLFRASLPPHLHPHPSGLSQSTKVSSLCYVAASHWLSILHTVVCICQTCSPNLSHPPLPTLFQLIHSLHLNLYSWPADRLICTIFLDSIHMFSYMIFVFLFLTYFLLYDRFEVHPHHYKQPNLIPFYGWVLFHCIYVTHLYPFISQWTFRLLPCPGYCK